MALITWNQDLSVQVSQFDNQHKELVKLVNELHDAMTAGKGNTVMGDVLNRLIDYTVNHFAAEERLMQQHHYPDYPAHKAEHENLTSKAVEIKQKFDAGKMVLGVEVMNFLRDWLTKHIMGVDKKYGPFFSEKGIN
jgi:hemerythrin